MNHKNLQLLVSSYLDGEVNDAEQAEVLAHLEVCSECRQFVKRAGFMREGIAGAVEVTLSSSFTARVMHSVEQKDEQTVEWLGIEPSARNTFILLVSLVVVLFFLTSIKNNGASAMNDQLFNSITSESVSTRVLLQQENLSRNDLLYAVMTK